MHTIERENMYHDENEYSYSHNNMMIINLWSAVQNIITHEMEIWRFKINEMLALKGGKWDTIIECCH